MKWVARRSQLFISQQRSSVRSLQTLAPATTEITCFIKSTRLKRVFLCLKFIFPHAIFNTYFCCSFLILLFGSVITEYLVCYALNSLKLFVIKIMTELYHWFDLIGVAVFAISGTLVAYEKKMDGFGVVVLATVTAIGGGTVRDVILDQPVFWLHDQSYFYAILAAVLVTTRLINKQKSIPYYVLQTADAFGLAFFAVMGAQKAQLAGMPDMTVIIMAVITPCFGGLIRDVLARDIPMLLKGELYAITCIAGGIVYTLAINLSLTVEVAMILSMLMTLLLRFSAIKWKIILHVFKYPD